MLAGSRGVTIVGPGGVGKTRVALVAAGQAADRYPDGPWIVELANLRHPGPPPQTVPRRAAAAAVPGHVRAPARRLRRPGPGRDAGSARRDRARHLAPAARHAGRAHLPDRAAARAGER